MDFLLTRLPFLGLWPRVAALDNVLVPIRASPLSSRMRRHLMRGGYESAERRLVAGLIKEGDHVLELGASIGILSSILWKTVGPHGRVLSVEANAELRPYFERQMKVNNLEGEWIEVLGCPIWRDEVPDAVRHQRFAPSQNNLGGMASASHSENRVEARWCTARQICHQYRMEPTAMVIDVEGSEAVLSTTSPTFPPSLKTIIIEIHPLLIGQEIAAACVQAVVDDGFRLAAFFGSVFGFRRR